MRRAAALAHRQVGGQTHPRTAHSPSLALGLWLKPAAMVVALAFVQLAVTFTAYRCLATEQALRQSLTQQSRRVATLSAKVRQVEGQVYEAVTMTPAAPAPDRPLAVSTMAQPGSAEGSPTLPCRSWRAAQSRCPEWPGPDVGSRDAGEARL